MNARSLKFRLMVWYAGLLTGSLLLLGGVTYMLLQRFLVSALSDSQVRRGGQIAELISEELSRSGEPGLGSEIEARFEPGSNSRFVRVLRRDGTELYRSSAPKDHSFEPAAIPLPAWPPGAAAERQVALGGGRRMLLTTRIALASGGGRYLIETGAPMDTVQASLRQWLWFLLLGLPAVGLVAIGGGYALVKKALWPVDQIAASAERISSQNLCERLPVTQTGDELERLTVALNRMIDRLDQAFQYSRRFMADASHELRTPLTVLRGELENIVAESGVPAERERLGSALEELVRLSGIVEGLFAISRLDAGEAAAEWMKFDLTQLAASTADQMELLTEDKSLHITCTGTKGVWVEGDRARIKQVVVNLLDNAIKYTLEGGSVDLTVHTRNGHALLEVADNGVGIPPEALPRVFDRFFRVDKARSRQLGGAGLGLSIVKSICAAHHGRVEATSAPGKGSLFRVELPLSAAPTESNQSKT